jgi:hypothetical protein
MLVRSLSPVFLSSSVVFMAVISPPWWVLFET